MGIARLWKPWFVYRPAQLLDRVRGRTAAAGSDGRLRTAWGMTLHADPDRDIGRSIVTTGIFDLAVSEAIARLLPPAGCMVDAGANVGYMTLLAAVTAGPRGTVHAFEPHPALFERLTRNVREAPEARRLAAVALHNEALGDQEGQAELLLPSGFSSNDGIARIVTNPGASDRTLRVRLRRLDEALGEGSSGTSGDLRIDLLKLDVEGHEPQVLAGAARLLSEHRIRHVVFEDHDVAGSDTVRRLRDAGYALFALGWTVHRLRLEPLGSGGLAHPYEAPSFVATLDPDGVRAACATAGWRTLRPWLGRGE